MSQEWGVEIELGGRRSADKITEVEEVREVLGDVKTMKELETIVTEGDRKIEEIEEDLAEITSALSEEDKKIMELRKTKKELQAQLITRREKAIMSSNKENLPSNLLFSPRASRRRESTKSHSIPSFLLKDQYRITTLASTRDQKTKEFKKLAKKLLTLEEKPLKTAPKPLVEFYTSLSNRRTVEYLFDKEIIESDDIENYPTTEPTLESALSKSRQKMLLLLEDAERELELVPMS